VADGVVVNEYLETAAPGIYAAGDVANYYDTLFEKRRRVEHWDNAVSQGQHCARTLMGDRAPFVHVPYFFSDVFDLSYELWGGKAESEPRPRGNGCDAANSTRHVRCRRRHVEHESLPVAARVLPLRRIADRRGWQFEQQPGRPNLESRGRSHVYRHDLPVTGE